MSRILVTVLSFNFLAAAHVSARAQKPVVEVPIIADYYDVPTTLDGFAERADAAVIARVAKAKDAPSKGRAQTIYEMQVLHTLKEHGYVGTTIQVCRPIGTVDPH